MFLFECQIQDMSYIRCLQKGLPAPLWGFCKVSVYIPTPTHDSYTQPSVFILTPKQLNQLDVYFIIVLNFCFTWNFVFSTAHQIHVKQLQLYLSLKSVGDMILSKTLVPTFPTKTSYMVLWGSKFSSLMTSCW